MSVSDKKRRERILDDLDTVYHQNVTPNNEHSRLMRISSLYRELDRVNDRLGIQRYNGPDRLEIDRLAGGGGTNNRVMGPSRRRNAPSRVFHAVAAIPDGYGGHTFQTVGSDPSLSTVRVRARIAASSSKFPVAVVDEHGKTIKVYDPARPRTMNMTGGRRLGKGEYYSVRGPHGEEGQHQTRADAQKQVRHLKRNWRQLAASRGDASATARFTIAKKKFPQDRPLRFNREA